MTQLCDTTPTGRPPLYQPPKPTHCHQIVWWFLSSPARGTFYFFTNTQDTSYTTERWKKERTNKQARIWVSSKHKMGEVRNTFLVFCASVGNREGVYSSEIHTQPPGMLTHFLTLANLASGHKGPGNRLSLSVGFPTNCLLLFTSVDWSLLFSALGPCLPSYSSGLVGDLARNPIVWVSCQNRRINLTSTHPHLHPQNRMPYIIPKLFN